MSACVTFYPENPSLQKANCLALAMNAHNVRDRFQITPKIHVSRERENYVRQPLFKVLFKIHGIPDNLTRPLSPPSLSYLGYGTSRQPPKKITPPLKKQHILTPQSLIMRLIPLFLVVANAFGQGHLTT
eukprot:4013040-Amphidinium_carterae.1